MGSSIYYKYPENCDFGGKKVLNIGCGFAQFKAPNVINLDAYDVCKPDVVCNLEDGALPFPDDTFDLVIANHILEHVHNWWECFNECARVLKPNGILEVYLPGIGNDSQLGYRDHVSMINHYSFYGIADLNRPATNAWAETNKNAQANRLKITKTGSVLVNVWWVRCAPLFLQNWMLLHLRNVVYENQYKFRKLSLEEMNRA